MYHGLAFVLLCVPVLFTDDARCQFTMVLCSLLVTVLAIMLILSVFHIATGFIAEMLLILFFVCNAACVAVENKA